MTPSFAIATLVAVVVAPRVAVMPVRGDADGAAQNVVRAALADTHVKLVDADAVARLVASAAHNGIACDASDGACAARIGAFGGLDFALVVDVSEPKHASVALYDCADGREVRRVSAKLDDRARNEGIAMLARAAVGEGEARGRIEVEAPAGGVVVVDGVERGAAPPPIDVDVGAHEVAWRAPNGTQRAQSVDVPAAASVHASFKDETATSPAASASPPLAAGGVVVGAALFVVGGVGAWLVAPTDRAATTARAYNDDVLFGRILLGAGVAGGVLAVIAGGAWLVEAAP